MPVLLARTYPNHHVYQSHVRLLFRWSIYYLENESRFVLLIWINSSLWKKSKHTRQSHLVFFSFSSLSSVFISFFPSLFLHWSYYQTCTSIGIEQERERWGYEENLSFLPLHLITAIIWFSLHIFPHSQLQIHFNFPHRLIQFIFEDVVDSLYMPSWQCMLEFCESFLDFPSIV